MTTLTTKYTFSGHDSFQCRQLWLKKGFDFIQNGNSFNDEDAVVKLGVGKNMVSSIRYWMKAFDIIDTNDKLTTFAVNLLDTENGYDPFLEDEGTLWLLHYQLVKTGHASIYCIVFNEFRKERLAFNKEVFLNYLKRRRETEPALLYNENTVADDFGVFIKMYQSNAEDVEDSFSGILSEIELLRSPEKGTDQLYRIENTERDKLPELILLYTILDNESYGLSVSLNTLEHDFNSPGSIFALNRLGMTNKIIELVKNNSDITFTDHAGIKELQFKKKSNPYFILDKYYGK